MEIETNTKKIQLTSNVHNIAQMHLSFNKHQDISMSPMSQIYKLWYWSEIELDLFCKMNRGGRCCVSLELYLYIDVLNKKHLGVIDL